MTIPARPSTPQVWAGALYLGAPATVVAAVAEGRELKAARWGLLDVVITIVGALMIPVIILSVAVSAGLPQHGSAILILGSVTVWLPLAGWPWLTTYLQGNGVRIDLGYVFRRVDLLWGIGGGVACFVLATPVGWLTEHFFGSFDSAAGNAALQSNSPRWVLVLYAIMICVGAPLFEELAFRGLVFAAVAKRMARHQTSVRMVLGIAGLWSTMLFAGIHLELIRVPVLLVIGAVLSYLRARTGRVGSSVIAHAVNNIPGALSIALLGM